ncbi:MAG: OmpH family outer membrane protein [Bacteroidetes bacterium]|nr:MAG: OmpH family outer membrane protein [Bacteroidota bacterium]
MKNGLLIWNIALTLVAGYLIYAHFATSKKREAEPKVDPMQIASDPGPFRIAYFEMDSIASGLYIVRDFRRDMNAKEEKNDGEIERMRRNFQRKFTDYQVQMQSGKMTQAQVEAANQEMKNLDDSIRTTKQTLDAEYNKVYSINETAIKKQIEDYLKDYNKDKTYAYIFANQPGLFYYCDTMYNITGAIVKGINEKYKGKKE